MQKIFINQQSDEQLMIQVMEHHSHPALVELHRRYAKKLLGYFVKMLNGDIDRAQDFVQDIFLRLLEKKHLFDPEKKFYTWVFTIAGNMCKTSYRQPAYQSLTINEELHRSSPGENLAEKERFHRLMEQSVAGLEHHHRTVFVLRYLEHFSLNEIAEITEASLGTVKSRLFYATRKMTEQLQAFDPRYETNLFKLL